MEKLTIQHLKCYFEAKWLWMCQPQYLIIFYSVKQVPHPPRYNKIWPYQMSHLNANGFFFLNIGKTLLTTVSEITSLSNEEELFKQSLGCWGAVNESLSLLVENCDSFYWWYNDKQFLLEINARNERMKKEAPASNRRLSINSSLWWGKQRFKHMTSCLLPSGQARNIIHCECQNAEEESPITRKAPDLIKNNNIIFY